MSMPATHARPQRREASPGACGDWLPEGLEAAVCLSVDDVHPGRSSDAYEAGGDLGRGALGHLVWLLERHPLLRVTLFVTPDWREVAWFPTRKVLARMPWIRDRVFLTPTLPKGRMRIDRHPEFVRYIQEMPRTEIGFHGLHHVHVGRRIVIEFQDESVEEDVRTLRDAQEIFRLAGLDPVPGMCPPGWEAPANLREAMVRAGMTFLASARDVLSPVSREAQTNMSGMKGVSLIYPEMIPGGLIHLPSNFAPNNPVDRALRIIELNGLLAFKGHIVKQAFGHTAIDGIDAHYVNYLDVVLSRIEDRYGDNVWWTSFDEIARRCRDQAAIRELTGDSP